MAEPPTSDPDVAALLETLGDVGSLEIVDVALPGADLAITVTRPTDTDTLLDRSADDPEQNLPYWAEIWPSGVALAAAIEQRPELVAGQRVIELGCGLGITAAAAMASGADLTVTDYAAEALVLTRLTCRRHTDREPRTLRVNWRAPDREHLTVGGRYPVVLAADVLYERRDVGPLLLAVETLLAPNGLLWLADPVRPPSDRFLAALAERGWSVETTRWDGPWHEPADAGVSVRTHLLRRHPDSGLDNRIDP